MSNRPKESLADGERRANQVMNAELDKHLTLAAEVFDLIGEAIGSIPDQPVQMLSRSLKVSLALLLRISNDLRAASLLALFGYATQAATIVASLYEAAMTVAYIGNNDALAQEWIDHDDPTKPFRDARRLTNEVVSKLPVANVDAVASSKYRVYRQLCMAKHSNPLYQISFGFEVKGSEVACINGPDTSEAAVLAATFALEHAAGLSLTAVASFVSCHVPSPARRTLIARINSGFNSLASLNKAAIARWGNVDPFPGRWRD